MTHSFLIELLVNSVVLKIFFEKKKNFAFAGVVIAEIGAIKPAIVLLSCKKNM